MVKFTKTTKKNLENGLPIVESNLACVHALVSIPERAKGNEHCEVTYVYMCLIIYVFSTEYVT